MLCTDCSQPVRPVAAIDIDGTLGDYHSHFLMFAETYVGRPVPGLWQYDGATRFREHVKASMGIADEAWYDIKLAYRQGAQKRSMPVYPYAADLCETIRREAELWLTTTRPYLRLDNVDPDTRAWLDRHEIPYDHLLYGDNKYQMLADRVDHERVVAVLEDLNWQWDHAASTFGWKVPILRRTAWNSGASPNGVGASSLEEAERLILDRITTWRETHESNRIGST